MRAIQQTSPPRETALRGKAAPRRPDTRFPLRVGMRLVLYGVLTLALTPVMLVALLAWPGLARAVPRLHHRLAAGIFGLRVHCAGEPVRGGKTLFVANHISYLDIIALGSVLDARFVAKSEVATWPFIGLLARLARTAFIQRDPRHARTQISQLRHHLLGGDDLIIFPEGTSTDGLRVLPFKTTLFATVYEDSETGRASRLDATVQPVSIQYTGLDGLPPGRVLRPLFAWYGAMELAPHLLTALSRRRIDVMIRFHTPVKPAAFPDRKALARHCAAEVGRGVEHAGRAGPDLT